MALEVDASNRGLRVLLEGCTRLQSLHIGSRCSFCVLCVSCRVRSPLNACFLLLQSLACWNGRLVSTFCTTCALILGKKCRLLFFRLVMQEQPGGRQYQHVPKRSRHEGFYRGGVPVFGDPYSCEQGMHMRVLSCVFPVIPKFAYFYHDRSNVRRLDYDKVQ